MTRDPVKLAQIRYGVVRGLELARADVGIGVKLELRRLFKSLHIPLIAEAYDRAFLSATNPARPRALQSGRRPQGALR